MRSLRRVDALPLPLSDLPCFLDGGPSLDPCTQLSRKHTRVFRSIAKSFVNPIRCAVIPPSW